MISGLTYYVPILEKLSLQPVNRQHLTEISIDAFFFALWYQINNTFKFRLSNLKTILTQDLSLTFNVIFWNGTVQSAGDRGFREDRVQEWQTLRKALGSPEIHYISILVQSNVCSPENYFWILSPSIPPSSAISGCQFTTAEAAVSDQQLERGREATQRWTSNWPSQPSGQLV